MRNIFFLLSFWIFMVNTSCNNVNPIKGNLKQSVNALIGDVSFYEKFGFKQEFRADEELRITTHLTYVENLLRKNEDNKFLSAAQKLKRLTVLKLLNDYTKLKKFPKNFDFPDQRVPCFIDKLGNICAVGYLIEKTAGRAVAEDINDKFKYEYVLAMKDKTITQWAAEHGLTLEECAMIQPTYDGSSIGYSTNNGVTAGYRKATLLSSAFNISVGTVNAVQLLKQRESKYMPIVGLASGVGQLILGVNNYPKSQTVGGVKKVNHDKVNHSLVNIGLGATTMILSGVNLIQNKPTKEKSFRWALQGLPLDNNEIALGVGMSLKL